MQRTDLLRHAEERVLDRRVEALERVVGRQQADDLSHEEGVAAGDLVQSRHRLVCRPRPRDRPDVVLEVGRGQPAQGDAPADAGEVGEDVTELAGAFLGLSVGRDEQDVGVRQRFAEKTKQKQRRLVRGVDVVESGEQRPLGCNVCEKAADRVEEAKALALRYDRARRRAPSGVRVAGSGELLQISSDRADHLHPRPVRRRAALLPAATRDDAHALLLGNAGELAHQPGLADPRLTGEEYERAAAGSCLLERRHQICELLRAPDERAHRGPACDRRWRDLVHGSVVHPRKC